MIKVYTTHEVTAERPDSEEPLRARVDADGTVQLRFDDKGFEMTDGYRSMWMNRDDLIVLRALVNRCIRLL